MHKSYTFEGVTWFQLILRIQFWVSRTLYSESTLGSHAHISQIKSSDFHNPILEATNHH